MTTIPSTLQTNSRIMLPVQRALDVLEAGEDISQGTSLWIHAGIDALDELDFKFNAEECDFFNSLLDEVDSLIEDYDPDDLRHQALIDDAAACNNTWPPHPFND